MAINKVEFAGNTLIDLTPTTAEAEDVAKDKVFLDKSGTLTQGTLVRGASDYETLSNKPSINNIELTGNKTTSDLGINIPTKVSDLTNDAGYITSYTETDPIFTSSVAHSITSTDVTNWNNKSNFSGNYNDLTNKPTLFSGDYNDLSNKPTIPVVPTNISSFTNDSGYITGLVMLEYGTSTWQDFQNAFNSNKIVYCKVSGRMAFLAYISSSNVEFQYYRSLSSPTISSQPDEVYVYTLTSAGVWSTTTRKASSTIDVGTGLSRSYTASSRTMTLSVDTSTIATQTDLSGFIDKDVNNLTNYSKTTDIQNNKNLTKGIEYIVGTQTSATSSWIGTSTDTGCSNGSIYTGKVIIYHLPVASSSSASTLNLTLPDGTTTGAKTIYRLASSTVTTTFGVDCDILMVYDGTNWKVNAYVDSNTNTIGYQLRTEKSNYINGGSASIYRYQLLVETTNGLEAFTSTSNSTKTTKTQLSPSYLPSGDIRYYSTTTEITSGSAIGTSVLWQQYYLDLRYSFNITSTTLTTNKPVYMKMSVNNDGTLSPVYSANSGGHPLVQDLPNTEDNYVYVKLGQAYSGYQIQLEMLHPMYEYKNGKIKIYTG